MKRKLQCDLSLKRTFTIEYKFAKIVSCTNDLALFFALSLSYVKGEEKYNRKFALRTNLYCIPFILNVNLSKQM